MKNQTTKWATERQYTDGLVFALIKPKRKTPHLIARTDYQLVGSLPRNLRCKPRTCLRYCSTHADRQQMRASDFNWFIATTLHSSNLLRKLDWKRGNFRSRWWTLGRSDCFWLGQEESTKQDPRVFGGLNQWGGQGRSKIRKVPLGFEMIQYATDSRPYIALNCGGGSAIRRFLISGPRQLRSTTMLNHVDTWREAQPLSKWNRKKRLPLRSTPNPWLHDCLLAKPSHGETNRLSAVPHRTLRKWVPYLAGS